MNGNDLNAEGWGLWPVGPNAGGQRQAQGDNGLAVLKDVGPGGS